MQLLSSSSSNSSAAPQQQQQQQQRPLTVLLKPANFYAGPYDGSAHYEDPQQATVTQQVYTLEK
jgi:hypothetical protein